MKNFTLSLFAAILSVPFSSSYAEVAELPGWTLVWNDEFSGPAVDTSVWETIHLRDSHNEEKQYYLKDQVSIVDGVLSITATDEPFDGKSYRSGRLWTHEGWSYGRFEAKAKLPTSQGMWPAIWLLPRGLRWPSGGEIDIMENQGNEPHKVSSAYHWGKDWSEHQYASSPHKSLDANGNPSNFHDSFHIYAVEWEPDALRFYVDGLLHYTVTKKEAPIPHSEMSFILNLAVGGTYGGDPDETTVFPQELSIDYVRVWKKKEAPSGESVESANK